MLPVLSYETALEHYTNVLVFIVYCTGFLTVSSATISDAKFSDNVNFWGGTILFAVYFGLHLFAMFWLNEEKGKGIYISKQWDANLEAMRKEKKEKKD